MQCSLKISDMVLEDNSVFFSNNMNEFFSLASTGILNWKQVVNSSLRPSIVNDFIFTVSEEGFLIVIDSKSGKIIRSTDVFDKFKIKKRKKN